MMIKLVRIMCILVVVCCFFLSTSYASQINDIEQGTHQTFIIYSDGSVTSCGRNFGGILGDGTDIDRNVLGPVLMCNCAKVQVSDSVMVLTNDHTVWTWGYNRDGTRGYNTTDNFTAAPVPNMTGVKDISAHSTNCFAIKYDGTIWGWGSNNYGSIGDGTTGMKCNPVLVKGLPPNIISISTSGVHTLALDNQGNVWAWGSNRYGNLGDGTTNDHLTPVQVPIDHVKDIEAGGYLSIALKDDGTVWTWGDNQQGELGDGSSDTYKMTPVQVSGLSDIIAISTNGGNVMALKKDGSVWAWGADFGILGNGESSSSISHNVPIKLNLQNIQKVSDGASYIVEKSDGSLWAWGRNAFGELGIGRVDNDENAIQLGVYYPTRMLDPGSTPLPSIVPIPSTIVTVTPTDQPFIYNTTLNATESSHDNILNTSTVTPINVSQPIIKNTSQTTLFNQNITPRTTMVSTKTVTPNSSINPSPGFSFNILAMVGCMLIIASLISGLKRGNGR